MLRLKYFLMSLLMIFSIAGWAQAPIITNVSPLITTVGNTVTLTGNNFSSIPDNNIVYFGGVKAKVTSSTSTSIEALLPASATAEAISVTVNQLTGYYYPVASVTFPGGEGPVTQQSFTIKNLLSVVDYRIGKKMADLDNDGKNELICFSPANVYIYRNTSVLQQPSFVFALTLPASVISSITLADIDGDGRQDIITAGSYGNSSTRVGVYINNSTTGQLSFAPPVVLGNTGQEIIFDVRATDLNLDGKPELVIINSQFNRCRILQNTTENGVVSFSPVEIDIATQSTPHNISLADLDGDGKPEITVTNINSSSVTYFLNTSAGDISFGTGISKPTGGAARNVIAADIDRDGKPDLVAMSFGTNGKIAILRNTSIPGTLTFEDARLFALGTYSNDLAVTDFSGEGLLDISACNTDTTSADAKSVSVLKNNSTPGNIDFLPVVNYRFAQQVSALVAGDVDGDGKPDILVTAGGTISILLNKTGYPTLRTICSGQPAGFKHPGANTYQWQLNTGSGFQDISNNTLYSGANSDSLTIHIVTPEMNGYQYRCVTDIGTGKIFALDIANEWKGTINSSWENPGNWSCGTVPDAQTNVHITSGTCTLNANATIYSLTVSNGAIFTVAPGVVLTILH
jgi:hypothetical protein